MAENLLIPVTKKMLEHIQHLFGDCMTGLVELAWTDRDTGNLQHAVLYDVGELDELVAHADKLNRVEGQNVYIGAGLRRMDAPRNVRASDADIIKLPALFSDFDVPGAAEAALEKSESCPPTLIVTTGQIPNLRQQYWWKLDDSIADQEQARHFLKSLTAFMGGDKAVVNPSRVMRLAGSIAWPLKPERVAEMTDLHIARRPSIMIESLDRAFPRAAELPVTSAATSASSLNLPDPKGLPVTACLNAVYANRQWHENVLRLTGRWVRAELSDDEILAFAPRLTVAGYSVEQTIRELRIMIDGARKKWNIPNPAVSLDQLPIVQGLRLMDWTGVRYQGQAPEIKWLIKDAIPLGVPVLLAAMGGIGKSFLALDLALHVALDAHHLSFPKVVLGGPLVAHGTAVILTAEDSFETIHRRFNKIDPAEKRVHVGERLVVVPMPNAGGPQPLIEMHEGAPRKTEFFNDLKAQLLEIKNLRLVVIDPLQAFVMADVTADPAAGQFMWTAFAELSSTAGATVIVTHHMRKDGMHRVTTAEEARENIRGSTALVDGARAVYALWRANTERAQFYCEMRSLEYEPGRVVQGAIVKANEEAKFAMQTYVRGESGLLVDQTDDYNEADPSKYGLPDIETANEIFDEVQSRWDKKNRPFSASCRSDRYLGKYIMQQYGVTRAQANETINSWLAQGFLEESTYDTRNKALGLFVAKRPFNNRAEVTDRDR